MESVMYPDHPMGRPILGPVEHIQNFTREDFTAYMYQHYCADNLIVSAAGNVCHTRVLGLVDDMLTDIKPGPSDGYEDAHYVGGGKRVEKDLEQVHFIVGFESKPNGHDDNYIIALLSVILGSGMTSRLFREIRERRGLVYSIHAYNNPNFGTGTFLVEGGTGREEVAELMPVLGTELWKIMSELVTEEELNRAKAMMKVSQSMRLESTASRMMSMEGSIRIHGRVLSTDEIKRRYDAVTREDIHRVANQIFSTTPSVTAVGPLDKLASYDDIIQMIPALPSVN